VLLVAALASVVWRQTVGRERFRELEKVREEVAVAEAERDELTTRILELQRRDRIVGYAQQRLGMHVARDEEVVLLPVPASAAARPDTEDER
jgi:cell division protein FtsL